MTNIQTAGKHIMETSIQFLADKHSATFEDIVAAIKAGNVSLKEQFTKLVDAGIEAAIALNAEGKISL